jgi:hypothetical protein
MIGRSAGKGRLRLALLTAVAGALLVSATVASASGHLSQSQVYLFADASEVDGASAQLTRTPNGVSMRLTTMELDPYAAYTVWWVIFNNPGACGNGVPGLTTCGEPDLLNPAVGAAVLYAAGHVTGMSGQASFAAGLKAGDLSGCQEPFDDFGLCGDGLTNPAGAEIHLVVRSHKEVIPAMMPAMIHTFAGGCTPGTSLGAGTGPNECEDQQFAAFVPVR